MNKPILVFPAWSGARDFLVRSPHFLREHIHEGHYRAEWNILTEGDPTVNFIVTVYYFAPRSHQQRGVKRARFFLEQRDRFRCQSLQKSSMSEFAGPRRLAAL